MTNVLGTSAIAGHSETPPAYLNTAEQNGDIRPRAIIPTLYRRPAQYTLSDTHPLPLPPRHAPDEVVAHFSVEGVRETTTSRM